MVYLIEPNKDKFGHSFIYLQELLKIQDTIALQMDVDIRPLFGWLNFLSVVKYYIALRKQLQAVPPNNIAHLLYADLYYKIPFVSSRLLHRNKTIVTMHSCPNGRVKHWLMKNFCKRVDAVVVHSEYIKQQLENMGLTNVHLIDYPSFYDYSTIGSRDEVRRKFGFSQHDIVLSALGGIRKDKGLDILLEAFKYINTESKKRIVLNIAGKEGFMTAREVEQKCTELEIRTHLTIRPLTDEEFMENVIVTDYMVMPYRGNMTGNSGPMTEAIVCGIPSVVPANTNLGYIADKESIGFTFIQENAQDLAGILTQILNVTCQSYPSNYSKRLTTNMFRQAYTKVYNNCKTL